MATLPPRVAVCIVGAGPAGLMAALTLQARGVSYVLVDREAPGRNVSRACVIQPFPMEILAHFGIADRLLARANPISLVQNHNRKQVTNVMDMFKPLGGATPFAHITACTQRVTESVLLEALVERGGKVHHPLAFSSLESPTKADDDFNITFEDGQTLKARFVIAADGMRSRVREALGVGWSTDDMKPEKIVLADAKLSNAEEVFPRDRSSLVMSPDGHFNAVPMPDGSYRLIAIVDDADAAPTIEQWQALVDERGPIQSKRIVVEDLTWTTRFQIREQVASTLEVNRRGFLIGDSAHVHSATGGQGLNIAIGDGYFLGEALTKVIAGESDQILADWGKKRKAVAERVVKLTAGILANFKAACAPAGSAPAPASTPLPPSKPAVNGSSAPPPNPLFVMANLVDRPPNWDPWAKSVL